MTPTIYIVDDEPDMAAILSEVAETVGLEVKVFHSALSFQQKFIEKMPELISMDISMPGMDGIELTQWLGKCKCTSEIIFISGYEQFYLELASKFAEESHMNVVGCYAKPLRPSVFRKILQKAISHKERVLN